MRIGIRYCGGCNPRYDRVKAVERLKVLLPDAVIEHLTGDGTAYDAVVLAEGCPNQCADVGDLLLPQNRIFYLTGFQDLLALRDALKTLDSEAAKGSVSLDAAQVQLLLPHRAPVLFVDYVEQLVPGGEIICNFFADPGHPVFKGHFPGSPVFPGTCAVEAMAQAADVLILYDRNKNQVSTELPLLLEVQKARFRRKIQPGDHLEIRAELTGSMPQESVYSFRSSISVGGQMAASCELLLAVRTEN
ncbi:MAG: 3-hydroxyacyl-ACP dehydratase FabZ family protein [Bilifractor sp.]